MDDPNATHTEGTALSRRIDTISTNVRQLFTAIVAEVHNQSEKGTDPVPALAAAMTLIETALIGIAEIADANQRLAALSEKEVIRSIQDYETAKAEQIAEAAKKSTGERNFIGKRS